MILVNEPNVKRDWILRCGGCGMIIDASADAVPGYCEELTGGPCGDCCGGPHIRQYVTRDMAMDAGDLSLEGQEL